MNMDLQQKEYGKNRDFYKSQSIEVNPTDVEKTGNITSKDMKINEIIFVKKDVQNDIHYAKNTTKMTNSDHNNQQCYPFKVISVRHIT